MLRLLGCDVWQKEKLKRDIYVMITYDFLSITYLLVEQVKPIEPGPEGLTSSKSGSVLKTLIIGTVTSNE